MDELLKGKSLAEQVLAKVKLLEVQFYDVSRKLDRMVSVSNTPIVDVQHLPDLSQLPEGILDVLLGHLSTPDLLKISQVSPRLKDLTYIEIYHVYAC